MLAGELLEHFRYEADVRQNCTTHARYQRNIGCGTREETSEKWYRQEIPIGKGSFSKVWKELRQLQDGQQQIRAVKEIDKAPLRHEKVDYRKELYALINFSKAKHRYSDLFVSFSCWWEDRTTVSIAMEYFEHGDLLQHAETISNENDIKYIIADVLEGLKFIHPEGFAHRDLKPQNIFVTDCPPHSARYWVKIGDFGFAKRARDDDTTEFRTKEVGSIGYTAPEILGSLLNLEDSTSYTNAVNIWAVGCIAYRLAAKRLPFECGHDLSKFCRGRSQFPEAPLRPLLSEEGIKFVTSLLAPSPSSRPSAEGALSDSWILNTPAIASHGESIVTSARPPDVQSAVINTSIQEEPTSLLEVSYPDLSGIVTPIQNNSIVKGLSSKLAELFVNTDAATVSQPRPQASIAKDSLRCTTSLEFTSFESLVTAIAISPNGKLIASGSEDSNVTIWNARTGAKVCQFWLKGSRVATAIFSPDSSLIASKSTDGNFALCLIKARTSSPRRLNAHGTTAFAFSSNGEMVALAYASGQINLFDSENFSTLSKTPGNSSAISCMAFSPNSNVLASTSDDCTLQTWDTSDRGREPLNPSPMKTKARLDNCSHETKALNFLSDGKVVLMVCENGSINLWNVAEGIVTQIYEGYGVRSNEEIQDALVSPDNKRVAYVRSNGRFVLCERKEDNFETLALPLHRNQKVLAATFSPWDHRVLLLIQEKGKIRLAAFGEPTDAPSQACCNNSVQDSGSSEHALYA